jgi:hypothetical protein
MRYNFFIFLFISASISVTAIAQKDSIKFSGTSRFSNQYRFFFKGEAHEYKEENANSLFALLSYLYKANNVRYLVMEIGPDQAFIINQYLQKGNKQLLEEAKPYLGAAFWTQVYTFNSKKKEKDKVKVVGFDFNRRLFTTRAFAMMLKDNPDLRKDAALKEAIEDVTRWDTAIADAGSDRRLEKDLKRLQNVVLRNESIVDTLIKKQHKEFIAILFNKTPAMSQVKRDRDMIDQFLEQLPLLKDGNFLFNYGIAHVFLNGVGAANILDDNKAFDKQVCSIYSYYKDNDKSKFLDKIEEDIPGRFHPTLDAMSSNTLVDLAEMKVYPGSFKKTQWLMVIDANSH